MIFEILETKRLLLRKVTPGVLDFVLSTNSDSEAMFFLGLEKIEELEQQKEKVKKGLTTYNRSQLYFHILNKEDNSVLGWCGYHTWYTDHDRAEIGYQLTRSDNWGKGIMSEAIEPIIRYGFEEMKLNRIEAFVGLANPASLAIVRKLGFVEEGHVRQHYRKDGVIQDSLIFGLLKQEYKSQ
jgi:[ribosomal protein S5]-alanine N-acetyltransferase